MVKIAIREAVKQEDGPQAVPKNIAIREKLQLWRVLFFLYSLMSYDKKIAMMKIAIREIAIREGTVLICENAKMINEMQND